MWLLARVETLRAEVTQDNFWLWSVGSKSSKRVFSNFKITWRWQHHSCKQYFNFIVDEKEQISEANVTFLVTGRTCRLEKQGIRISIIYFRSFVGKKSVADDAVASSCLQKKKREKGRKQIILTRKEIVVVVVVSLEAVLCVHRRHCRRRVGLKRGLWPSHALGWLQTISIDDVPLLVPFFLFVCIAYSDVRNTNCVL